MKVALACVSAALFLSSCSSADHRTPTSAPRTSGASSAHVPAPDVAISSKPWKLARSIEENERELLRGLRTWVRNGAHLDGAIVDEIKLRALFQQRITRRLVTHVRLSRKVLERLEGRNFSFLRANIQAQRTLSHLSGTPPEKPPRYRYARAEPPKRLISHYDAGRRRFGVPRSILASVNFVETKFGRVLGPSTAGALGPMQFLPSTWEAYGNGGDILDPHDSIIGAARYLSASGAPERVRAALHAYNPSDAYVKTVLIYAKQMRKNPLRFYDYYFWQVFVGMADGIVQLTGPGSPRPNL